MIEVLYIHYQNKFSSKVWNKYLRKMPKGIQDRINCFKKWQDQQSRLLGKILLLEGLRRYGYPPDFLNNLSYDKYNRPFIDSSIDFNISHSGEYVVCAISNKGRVGIDIEKIKPIELMDFKEQMTLEQWQDIKQTPDRYEKFYEYWTVKESVLKCDGRGLSIPLLDIHIKGNKAFLHDSIWFVRKIDVNPYYCCQLATNLEKANIKINEFFAS